MDELFGTLDQCDSKDQLHYKRVAAEKRSEKGKAGRKTGEKKTKLGGSNVVDGLVEIATTTGGPVLPSSGYLG